jgi:hypothetical protein
MPNRRSSELDIRETETRAFSPLEVYVLDSQTVVSILSAMAILKLLSAIGFYHPPLAAAVRRFYRCHLREDKRKIIRQAVVR